MTPLQIALASLAVVLLLAWWVLHRRGAQASRPASAPSDRIDTITGWPPQATRVLTTRERSTYGMLVKALPEYIVLAQVPMSRFLNVPKRHSYADWLRRVGYQCVDFAICDSAAQVVAVIELQAETAALNERAQKRAARMSRSLAAANIPLLTWRVDAIPAAGAVRDALVPRIAAAQTKAQPSPKTKPPLHSPTAASVASAVNPFDEIDRDSSQDEKIELLEPPPSTWFDELDSEPMPLNKR